MCLRCLYIIVSEVSEAPLVSEVSLLSEASEVPLVSMMP